MGKLRILLVTNKCPPDFDGGFELRAFQLAQALRARGHELDVVTSRYRPTFRGEQNDPPWVHRIFRFVPVSQSKTWWRKVERITLRIAATKVGGQNRAALEQHLAGREYDLAYHFGLHRVGLALAEPLVRRGIPILWHAGDNYLAEHLHHLPRTLPGYALSLRLFAGRWFRMEQEIDYRHIAFVSKFLRDDCARKGLHPQYPYVISRGIDFPLAPDVDRPRTQPPVFFLAGRIDPTKGVHIVVAAAGLLLRKRPELAWKIEFGGLSNRPHYQAEIDAQIAQEKVGDRIAFVGQLSRAEVTARMKSATAYIFSSVYGEPFSSTIIESMACGTPLIGADDGSILEVAEAGISAFVYRKNEPAELAAHMETVLDNPALAQRVAAAGIETVRARYTIDRILDQTEATFAEVIAHGLFRP
ncbi:MAG: glycosyltransferase family 4 protein [Chthoniobacter sp.]|nr:glycosyltransferase family 4 protein [Chthoniobacter sp.]